ncbi:MAG: TssQ family T6SS-associated lipoprotein [Rhodocyclaceae bacterium]|nr:TssQ family T6SS-associated lipoprotein [Rhodocyclaceae bacterium]
MSPRICRIAGAALLALLLSACAARQGAAPVVDRGRNWQSARLALEQGRQRYEQGRYEQARLWLEEALTLGLGNTEEKVEAHKLAAFIACVESRLDACRHHFGALLAIDPGFELARAEVGHPMWGPVFAEVKHAAARR